MFRCTLCLDMVSYFVILIILISANVLKASSDDADYVKPKRVNGRVTGLFPYARMGRSDPDLMNWDNANAYNSFEEYEEYPHTEMKRQGLVPFPRVGRSGPSKYLSQSGFQANKRAVSGGGSGMWFGPRLGRIQKRNSEMVQRGAMQGDQL